MAATSWDSDLLSGGMLAATDKALKQARAADDVLEALLNAAWMKATGSPAPAEETGFLNATVDLSLAKDETVAEAVGRINSQAAASRQAEEQGTHRGGHDQSDNRYASKLYGKWESEISDRAAKLIGRGQASAFHIAALTVGAGIETAHLAWLTSNEALQHGAQSFKHPLGGIALERASSTLTETETREIGVMPMPLVDHISSGGPVRAKTTVGDTQAVQLSLTLNGSAAEELPALRGYELLVLPEDDQPANGGAAGRDMPYDLLHPPPFSGGGCDPAIRTLMEILMSVPLQRRSEPGTVRMPPISIKDLVTMVFPGCGRYQHKSKWDRTMKSAMQRIDGARIWLASESDYWKLVTVLDENPGRDGYVRFAAHLPAGSHQGASINRYHARDVGSQSAAGYRALLYLACMWDKYLTAGGRRSQPLIPEVKTDRLGRPVDDYGNTIFVKGKAVHWSHPKAVRSGTTIRNPAMDKLPVLRSADLAGVVYPGAEAGYAVETRADQHRAAQKAAHKRRERAVRAVAALADKGLAIVETADRKWHWKHGIGMAGEVDMAAWGHPGVRILPPP